MIAIGIVLALLLVFGKYFFTPIPPKYYAIFNIFGKRWCARPEGLWFRIPYVEGYELISKEIRRKEISITAKTKDLLTITIRGALKFFPDFNLLMRFDDSYKEIEASIADEIESELGILAGIKDAKDFVHNRLAIALIINSKLRLKIMPHQTPESFGEARREIPVEERLDFYNRNQSAIEEMLEEENQRPEDRSPLEERYGIDVAVFDLNDPEFSKETNVAFEALRQAEAKIAAALKQLELVEQFKEAGASPREAIDSAQVALGEAQKIVHSVHGKPVDIKIGGG